MLCFSTVSWLGIKSSLLRVGPGGPRYLSPSQAQLVLAVRGGAGGQRVTGGALAPRLWGAGRPWCCRPLIPLLFIRFNVISAKRLSEVG